MAVTFKDINQLVQKSSVAGTEKLPISDTQYITLMQIAALALLGEDVDKVVALTTAEYEALSTKDANTIYIITDAPAIQIVPITTAQYEALSSKDPNTLYVITDSSE